MPPVPVVAPPTAARSEAEWWLNYLSNGLEARRPLIEHYSAYYDGRHRMAFATSKYREAFGELFGEFATNWCGLVVDAAVQRLSIDGFRFGQDDADQDAWRMWQANNLDAKSIQGHTESVKTGYAYLLVGPPRREGGEPVITVEHPSQCIVAHDPADRGQRLAALKTYADINGDLVAVVYLPNTVTTFRRRDYSRFVRGAEVLGLVLPSLGPQDWESIEVADNPVGVVPMIPLENAPNLLTGGTSDLRPAIALNDAANKFFTDMIHASEYTSFPQRILTGVELPTDPVTGEVLPDVDLRAAVSRCWAFEDPNASVHQLPVGSLDNYVKGIELAVQHLAAQTSTPAHYLLAQLVNISGDALKAAETGLVSRCRRKHIDFSEPWEDGMRLGFRWRAIMRGSPEDWARSEMLDAETMWSNPESQHASTLGDSLVKKGQVGVPEEMLWEEAGYSPQQIARMRILRDRERRRQEQLELQRSSQNQEPERRLVIPNAAS